MAAVTRHTLRVYAALAELSGNNENILDALIPFFEPILEVMHGKVFDPRLFATGVQNCTGGVSIRTLQRSSYPDWFARNS
jgi:hypothetical protein